MNVRPFKIDTASSSAAHPSKKLGVVMIIDTLSCFMKCKKASGEGAWGGVWGWNTAKVIGMWTTDARWLNPITSVFAEVRINSCLWEGRMTYGRKVKRENPWCVNGLCLTCCYLDKKVRGLRWVDAMMTYRLQKYKSPPHFDESLGWSLGTR